MGKTSTNIKLIERSALYSSSLSFSLQRCGTIISMASKNLSVTTTLPPSKTFTPEGDASRMDTSEESQEMTLFVQDLLEQMVREKLDK
jgi:hypothetical protein